MELTSSMYDLCALNFKQWQSDKYTQKRTNERECVKKVAKIKKFRRQKTTNFYDAK